MAASARLHLDYGWPLDLLGMQSADNAFDAMAFETPECLNERVAVEVKRDAAGVRRLLKHLALCCAGEHADSCYAKGTRRNAHKKWVAINARRPPLFWAVGPYPVSRVFAVVHDEAGGVQLEEVSTDRLHFE
ncbi:MAG: hypothetical protein ACR2F0_08410 [Chthoniobacterales bacterium]